MTRKQIFDSGSSIISKMIQPLGVIFNESVTMIDDKCTIHIVFWKDLTIDQQEDLLLSVLKTFDNEVQAIIVEDFSEYKFYFKDVTK